MIYAGLSHSKKKWVDTLGDVFLMLPFTAVMFWLSIGFVMRSYKSAEGSDYGGVAGVLSNLGESGLELTKTARAPR